MILFWLICAGLVAIALAFILPTLLQVGAQDSAEADSAEANLDVYRDQLSELETDQANGIISPEQYQQDRDEIERRLLDDVSSNAASQPTSKQATKPDAKKSAVDRGPVYALAAGIPLVAIALFLILGKFVTNSSISGTPATVSPEGPMTQQGIEANVAKLAQRLEQNPNDAEGWTMLARSYLNLEKYSEASKAYERATALKTDDADLLTEYAFVLAMTNNRQLAGQPRELVAKALQIEPENAKALELAGSAECQAKNYTTAIEYWQKVLAKSPPNSELARTVTARINEAKSLAEKQ